MAWRVMPDLQTFGAVPPSPDTHSCYQGSGNDSPRPMDPRKLTMSTLAGAGNSDMGGKQVFMGLSPLKHIVRDETELFPKERGQVGDLGNATLRREGTDPGPLGTAAGALRAAPLELRGGITSIHLDKPPWPLFRQMTLMDTLGISGWTPLWRTSGERLGHAGARLCGLPSAAPPAPG